MFNPQEKPKYQRMIETELERALRHLGGETITTQDYAKTLANVERLHDMMAKETPSPVSKDTLATVAANLVGIILILKHEWAHPITSKALSFVVRAR